MNYLYAKDLAASEIPIPPCFSCFTGTLLLRPGRRSLWMYIIEKHTTIHREPKIYDAIIPHLKMGEVMLLS